MCVLGEAERAVYEAERPARPVPTIIIGMVLGGGWEVLKMLRGEKGLGWW